MNKQDEYNIKFRKALIELKIVASNSSNDLIIRASKRAYNEAVSVLENYLLEKNLKWITGIDE